MTDVIIRIKGIMHGRGKGPGVSAYWISPGGAPHYIEQPYTDTACNFEWKALRLAIEQIAEVDTSGLGPLHFSVYTNLKNMLQRFANRHKTKDHTEDQRFIFETIDRKKMNVDFVHVAKGSEPEGIDSLCAEAEARAVRLVEEKGNGP
ncbi:MAG: hypothetical protein K6F46_09970 [Desulfovibrio sp.]|nr:hypothetical protein [Desulfovibrio sp.]